jgi:16S rRNA (cytidine1402-2'-O)-methyltransferase
MLALHDHNEKEISNRIVRALNLGRDVALVSDAGTPLLSDPGFLLVSECFQAGLPVRPVPGASALICALSVCPLPTADFRFIGFLPAKSAARRTRIAAAADHGPVVFFEAPHRMAASLRDIAEVVPGRRVFFGREMTKKFESYLCDFPDRLAQQLEAHDQLRGEFVCILEGPADVSPGNSVSLEKAMRVLGRELAPAQAARIGAELFGINRRELYDLLQADKSE